MEQQEFLPQLRAKLSLSRQNLADMMEVSEQTVIRWEDAQKGREIVAVSDNDLMLLKNLEWLHETATSSDQIDEVKILYALLLGKSGSKRQIKSLLGKYEVWAALSSLVFPMLYMAASLISVLGSVNKVLGEKRIKEKTELLTNYITQHGTKSALYLAGYYRIKGGYHVFQ